LLQQTAVLMSTKRIVSAIHGYCLGAGMELAFQCPQVVAHADAMVGLPESKVGLFPGGAGTVELGLRSQPAGAKAVVEAARLLALGETSTNADQARSLGFLRSSDVTVYHPERLITEARKAALEVEPQIRLTWHVPVGPVTGMVDQMLKEQHAKGNLTEHGMHIGEKIKFILTRATSFENACELERNLFVELCRNALTHARIKHMMETGKPLPN
jgi:3-hydroxyacyl-CoA dehydrogenase